MPPSAGCSSPLARTAGSARTAARGRQHPLCARVGPGAVWGSAASQAAAAASRRPRPCSRSGLTPGRCRWCGELLPYPGYSTPRPGRRTDAGVLRAAACEQGAPDGPSAGIRQALPGLPGQLPVCSAAPRPPGRVGSSPATDSTRAADPSSTTRSPVAQQHVRHPAAEHNQPRAGSASASPTPRCAFRRSARAAVRRAAQVNRLGEHGAGQPVGRNGRERRAAQLGSTTATPATRSPRRPTPPGRAAPTSPASPAPVQNGGSASASASSSARRPPWPSGARNALATAASSPMVVGDASCMDTPTGRPLRP